MSRMPIRSTFRTHRTPAAAAIAGENGPENASRSNLVVVSPRVM